MAITQPRGGQILDNSIILTPGVGQDVTGTLPVGNGGTGAASLTANNVILGNGTSAVQVVAPSSSGNVLTSSGGTWVSAPSGGVGSGISAAVARTECFLLGGM